MSILRCENIHKSYSLGRTELHVLRGIDLTIPRGQFVSIIGNSGSGKSTLLHVLSGLDVPQRGQVHFENQPLFEPEAIRKIPRGRNSDAGEPFSRRWQEKSPDLSGRSAQDVARRPGPRSPSIGNTQTLEPRRNQLLNEAFGFVFQFYHLLPEFDVLENVLLPAMVGHSMAGWLAQRAKIEHRARALLQRVGLQDRLDHRPNELSGGERQRVAIARALMNEPRVLFADEPTDNLDAKTGREIFDLLKDLNGAGQTIVIVTHDRDLAAETDVVVQLVDGRVK